MEQRMSVNGVLIPDSPNKDNEGNVIAEDRYRGHYLKISYTQSIREHDVFATDRADVAPDGSFRFFIPKKELLSNQEIKVEVYAPDGSLIDARYRSYGTLGAAEYDESAEDQSDAVFKIEVNPRNAIGSDALSPVEEGDIKIRGRVIDLSGERAVGALTVIIMVSDDVNADYDSATYRPIFSAVTDGTGYFGGRVSHASVKRAYGIIAGLESQPVAIALDDGGRLPSEIILVSDLSTLPEGVGSATGTGALPEGDDLVNSKGYSQDIGGSCVNFTIPNRTLEEFSFYHTVRTTEPEIRGLTINATQSAGIKADLLNFSDQLFTLFGKLNNSFRTVSVLEYTVEDVQEPKKEAADMTVRSALNVNTSAVAAGTLSAAPVYHLKVASAVGTLKLKSSDLLDVRKGINFAALVKLLADQRRRRDKLNALHRKLAAAYCGKKGAQEAQSYCESLVSEDALNRDTIASLLGHIREYPSVVKPDTKVVKLYVAYLSDLQDLIDISYADAEAIALVQKNGEKLTAAIDKNIDASEDQRELLEYLRRVIVELANAAKDTAGGFEPCPPKEVTETMGVLCVMQEFEETRTLLRNKAILTFGEILTIRSSYDTFLHSITAFLGLLDEFYSFYKSSKNFMISLEDDYFVMHYSSTKNQLTQLKRMIQRAVARIEKIENDYITNHPGRRELSVETSIDWDDTPTVYENTTIAHGHILHFKQKWKADGYSLGDLLYSLPLAPCQEKQIAILEWDRDEFAARTESQTVTEALSANISRDRDISEIMSSALSESIHASSTNKVGSTSAGIGGGLGGFLSGITFGLVGGVSHSGGSSSSTSDQNGYRHLTGSTLNRLQDNVSQAASAVRGQRSTVVQSIGQSETVHAQTEVIKNNNHCHAMTVQYFEVLKHYALEQELVDVQECLFVPLPMSDFDNPKVLRWSDALRRSLYGRKLRRGIDAIERIESHYANSDLPTGPYCDVPIEEFTGYFTLSFNLTRPYISEIEDATKKVVYDLTIPFPWFGRKMTIPIERDVELTEAEKDAMFEAEFAPDIVREFIEYLEVTGIDADGNETQLDLDYTVMSNYRKGRQMRINIASKSIQEITRRDIKHLRFGASTFVTPSSKIILHSAYLHYRTPHLSEYIVRNGRINNDIINTREVQIDFTNFPPIDVEIHTDAALLYTPMNSRETRDPRKEDNEAAQQLIAFLNEHLEMSHKVIWSQMDSSRLFGLLDGYIAPNTNGKSVASVVENRIMGIVGNNLVLKVIPGERIDPVFRNVTDLMAYYRPTTKPDPFRISVPTKGVYAESVMGACNSCEEIDDNRHWRFEDVPCGTSPTAIGTLSTDSRRAETGDLQVKDLPTNIIAMQSAPAAPDPTGLAAAYNAIAKSDLFKDMTGLAGTQANALQALQTTSKSVTDLAGKAAEIQKQQAMQKDIGKTLKTIKKAEDDKQIDKDQAKKLSYTALSSMVGESTQKKEKLSKQDEVKKAIEKASTDKNKNITIKQGDESVTITVPKACTDAAGTGGSGGGSS